MSLAALAIGDPKGSHLREVGIEIFYSSGYSSAGARLYVLGAWSRNDRLPMILFSEYCLDEEVICGSLREQPRDR